MNMPISRMTRDMQASMAKVKAEIDQLGRSTGKAITGVGADGLLKIDVSTDRSVTVSVHPGLVRDQSERDRVEAAVAEAVHDAFLTIPADMPEVAAMLKQFEDAGSEQVAATQDGLRDQLASIDAYFDSFKARLHGPRQE